MSCFGSGEFDWREPEVLEENSFGGVVHNLNWNDLRNERVSQIGSAAIASGIACFLYSPLDCLRVRWQVADARTSSSSLIKYGADIVRREGLVNGLWKPGLTANVAGMTISGGLRYGYYEDIRDALVSSTTTSSYECSGDVITTSPKNGVHMLGAGIICGSFAYLVTAPCHLLKTMIQAEKSYVGMDGLNLSGSRAGRKPYVSSFVSGTLRVAQDRGILSLWKGSLPLTSRGALFTAGQFCGYDGFKTHAKNQGIQDGPWLHIVASVSAAFGASFLSAPADFVMAKYMSSTTNNNSLANCVRDIYTENGIRGFWKGWSVFFVRLTPAMLTSSVLYEFIRKEFGLGYLS